MALNDFLVDESMSCALLSKVALLSKAAVEQLSAPGPMRWTISPLLVSVHRLLNERTSLLT